MLTYGLEKWAPFWVDCQKVIPDHWAEMAIDQKVIKLDIDVTKYQWLDDHDMLQIFCVRDDGKLAGYHLTLVYTHLRYASAGLMGFTDMYYLRPEYRKGSVGVALFKGAEKALSDAGVVKIYTSCKAHQDHTKLFEAMGYRLTDLAFTKLLGD